MEFLMDPSIWAGLLTLVVLEIVLGIDNLSSSPFLLTNCCQNNAIKRVITITGADYAFSCCR